MKPKTALVCLDKCRPDKNFYYQDVTIKYAFNYDKVETYMNLDNLIGNHVKNNIKLYSEWIELIYNSIFYNVRNKIKVQYDAYILDDLYGYARKYKNRRKFNINDMNQIFNKHSDLAVYKLLFKFRQEDEYGAELELRDLVQKQSGLIDCSGFNIFNLPRLVFEKINEYLMVRYVVHIECNAKNGYKCEEYRGYELSNVSMYDYDLTIPGIYNNNEISQIIGRHIKNHIDKYDFWIRLLIPVIKDNLENSLYHSNPIEHYDYWEKMITWDNGFPHVNMQKNDLENYINNIIEDDEKIYNFIFKIYIGKNYSYKANLLDITNIHYINLD